MPALGHKPAYDGAKSCFAFRQIPDNLLHVEVSLTSSDEENAKERKFDVIFQSTGQVSTNLISEYLRGAFQELPREEMQALDIVFRHQSCVR